MVATRKWGTRKDRRWFEGENIINIETFGSEFLEIFTER